MRQRTNALSMLVDEQARALEATKTKFQHALGLLRGSCGHEKVVEVEQPQPGPREGLMAEKGRMRFCLGCGDKEYRGDPRKRFGLMKAEPVAVLPTSAFENLHERLHLKVRFDEFDEHGNWCPSEPDYTVGTD